MRLSAWRVSALPRFRVSVSQDVPMPYRPERVREFIKEQVSEIIQHQLKDPRIGFASVTDVEVSADLRYAKVFISVLGDAQAKTDTMAGAQRTRGYVRIWPGQR